MENSLSKFFDDLRRKSEILENSNEAMWQSNIIAPMLSSPLTLGWHDLDLRLEEYKKGYYPDITIIPHDFNLKNPIMIVESKRKQKNIESLNKHLDQLKRYLDLDKTTWGLLSDGNGWILMKNGKVFHTFSSITEIQKYMYDLQYYIGKQEILKRLAKFETVDIVVSKYSNNVYSIADPFQYFQNPMSAYEYMSFPSYGVTSLISLFSKELDSLLYRESSIIHNFRQKMANSVMEIYSSLAHLELEGSLEPVSKKYYENLKVWLKIYPELYNTFNNIPTQTPNLIELFYEYMKEDRYFNFHIGKTKSIASGKSFTDMHHSKSLFNFLDNIYNHPLFNTLNSKLQLSIKEQHEKYNFNFI